MVPHLIFINKSEHEAIISLVPYFPYASGESSHLRRFEQDETAESGLKYAAYRIE
jgi:hypothetical protein